MTPLAAQSSFGVRYLDHLDAPDDEIEDGVEDVAVSRFSMSKTFETSDAGKLGANKGRDRCYDFSKYMRRKSV
jgi:hypothetical protein